MQIGWGLLHSTTDAATKRDLQTPHPSNQKFGLLLSSIRTAKHDSEWVRLLHSHISRHLILTIIKEISARDRGEHLKELWILYVIFQAGQDRILWNGRPHMVASVNSIVGILRAPSKSCVHGSISGSTSVHTRNCEAQSRMQDLKGPSPMVPSAARIRHCWSLQVQLWSPVPTRHTVFQKNSFNLTQWLLWITRSQHYKTLPWLKHLQVTSSTDYQQRHET